MRQELFTRMQYEPCVLMFGKKYKRLSTDVLSYRWNALVTTSTEIELSAKAKDEGRFVQDVFERSEMQANLLDRRNLHIIHLFGEKYPDENIDEMDQEDIMDQAVAMLSRVSEVIMRNGIVIIEDFEESCFSHKELRKAFRNLYSGQRQIHIFNCVKKDQYLTALEEQGIAVLYEEGFNDYFEEYLAGEELTDIEATNESVIKIYIDSEKKATPINFQKKYLLETESFAELLNIDLLNSVRIPENMFKDYFYMFLKNSVREPQWYGYNYGFNLHRSYEDRLYRKVKKGLENVGNATNKPLAVVGQTGTGKSISLAAISHRIFNEKKYPVVFINDPDINFYTSSEYKQKGVNKKGSPAFNALDSLLERLENLGAKATLLVWDTSSFSTGRRKALRLYNALLARGRKVFLLCTAYETNKDAIIRYSEDEFNEEFALDNKFVECQATIEVSSEIEQLKDILLNKCKMPKAVVDGIMNFYIRSSQNFLSMFYQAFDILRSDLSKGVYKEASYNLKELDSLLESSFEEDAPINNVFAIALKKAESELIEAGIVEELGSIEDSKTEEISIAKDSFVKCIAVCSQFKIKMPYDFALRILGTYNDRIIQTLTRSTFFVISQDSHNNYEVSLRTPLEAKMYIEAKGMSCFDEIECIVKMLKTMNPSGDYGQQKEVRMCEKLIRIVGPNNHENKGYYKRGYEEIIATLKYLREECDIWEPILISQEITYIREYYGADENRSTFDRIDSLKEAISIADQVLSKSEFSGIPMGTRNAIIVESANSKLLLCKLNDTNDSYLYKELRRDLRNVIRYDNLDYHAYVTLMKGSIIEYNNEHDKIKKIDLMQSMCSIADEIMFENPDVASSKYFQEQVTEIYSLLDDSATVQAYIDELVANGSSAGLYVAARKILRANNVDYRLAVTDDIQLSACKKVYSLFNDPKYKNVVVESEECQYMLLNMVWLINDKRPIIQEGECWLTAIPEDGWRELLNICNNFIIRFCSDAEEIHQLGRNIRYLKALCQAELGMYSDSMTTLKSIEEDSSLGLKRVFTKHMICEWDGTIRKFTGRLGKYDETRRSGEIYIEEFGKNPMYYYGPHMNTSNLQEGTVYTDIEVGYGNIAPKAFREVEVRN